VDRGGPARLRDGFLPVDRPMVGRDRAAVPPNAHLAVRRDPAHELALGGNAREVEVVPLPGRRFSGPTERRHGSAPVGDPPAEVGAVEARVRRRAVLDRLSRGRHRDFLRTIPEAVDPPRVRTPRGEQHHRKHEDPADDRPRGPAASSVPPRGPPRASLPNVKRFPLGACSAPSPRPSPFSSGEADVRGSTGLPVSRGPTVVSDRWVGSVGDRGAGAAASKL
jgi:hypothetical protein